MEFLRFGSSIPGSYWGCCAMDIIQDFKQDPDAPASIELVDGDGGVPIPHPDGGSAKFAGKTYKDIFLQRLRYGTFSSRPMPNHGFLAILTDWQIKNEPGVSWLKILKEQGFEFIRTVDNSVYTGQSLVNEETLTGSKSSKPNYLFGLFRNVGSGTIKDPFTPPKAWQKLDSVVPEAWQTIPDTAALTEGQKKAHLALYNNLPDGVFYTEQELEKEGVPVTYAGKRSTYPQQLKSLREATKKLDGGTKVKAPAPFKKEVSTTVAV